MDTKRKSKYGNIIWIDEEYDYKGFNKNNDETDFADIWDNGEDDLIDYSDLSGYEFENDDDVEVDEETEARWEAIEKLQGTIEYGKCIYCGLEKGMHFNKDWFFCKTCHDCVPAEVYYQWYAGFDVFMTK